MPNTDAEVEVVAPYKESDDFLPNPTEQFGTLDTSGTAGSAHANIREITPIFNVAEAKEAIQAARALDPDDDGVDSSSVVLPGDGPTAEEATERINAKAQSVKDSGLLEVGGKTAAQKEAAQEGDEGAATAQGQQQSSGAGSPGVGGNDVKRQTGKASNSK